MFCTLFIYIIIETKNYIINKGKSKIWIILFIIGIVMILGASEFSRFLANEINWYTAGIILSIVSGLGLLFEMYFRRNK